MTGKNKQTSSFLGAPVISSSNSLSPIFTPNTVKSITQLLESSDCLKTLEKYDETGQVTVVDQSKIVEEPNNPIVVSSNKNWQGGITFIANDNIIEEENVVEATEDKLPEPIVVTNRMMTRSLSRSVSMNNAVKRELEEDPDYIPEMTPPKRTRRGNTGAGRKPASSRMSEHELNMPPEERKKLLERRQRNKEAARRCRERRENQKNDLQDQVNVLLAEKKQMEEEIARIKQERKQLEMIMRAHCNNSQCVLGGLRRQVQQPQVYATISAVDLMQQPQEHVQIPQTVSEIKEQSSPYVAIKSEPVIVEPANAPYVFPDTMNLIVNKEEKEHQPLTKPKRPSTLEFEFVKPKENKIKIFDEEFETPSKNISLDVFSTTGLTPTATSVIFTPTLNTPTNPTCSSQQRSSEVTALDLNTPDGTWVSL